MNEQKFEPLDHDLTLRKLRELRDSLIGPLEALPYKASGWHGAVDDANGKQAFRVYGYGGSCAEGAPGIAERKRILYQVDAMLDLIEDIAQSDHDCPFSIRARRILDRIDGASNP